MRWRAGCVIGFMTASIACHAVTAGFTDDQVVKILDGIDQDPVHEVELARGYDEGTPADKSYCYAKYLYEMAAKRTAHSPEQQAAIDEAKTRLDEMKRDGVRCEVKVNARGGGSVDSILSVNMFHDTGGMTGASGGGTGGTNTSGNIPKYDPKQPADVADYWRNRVDDVTAAPATLTTIASNDIPTHFDGVVSAASTQRACQANASLLARYHREAGMFAELSRLAYSNPLQLSQLSNQLEDLRVKVETIEADPNRPLWQRDLEGRRVQRRADKLARTLDEARTKLEAKGQYVANAGLKPLATLMDDFRRYTRATQKALDDSGFWADAYELPDGVLAVAFRGTADKGGALTDLAQLAGADGILYNGMDNAEGAIGQYEQASQLIKMLLERGYSRDRVIVAGHSLGGGLATYVMVKYSLRMAYAYNPAEIGRVLQGELAAYPHRAEAANRVLNFVSYSPKLGAADMVSQGSARLAELAENFGVSAHRLGRLFGPVYFMPIEVGMVSRDMHDVETWFTKEGLKTGVMGTPTMGQRVAAMMFGANFASVAAKGTRGEAYDTGHTVAETGQAAPKLLSSLRHPIWTAVKSTAFTVAGRTAGRALSKMMWSELSLHSIENLADGMTAFNAAQSDSQPALSCAVPEYKEPPQQIEYQGLKARLYREIFDGELFALDRVL